MKTSKLTFNEVANRIIAGLCSRFRYGDNAWWYVVPTTKYVRKRTQKGISIRHYMQLNQRHITSAGYTVQKDD